MVNGFTGDIAIAGVVLAGGASRRMGSDKALLEVDGLALAVRVAAVLDRSGCSPVWCQGGDTVRLTACGLKVVADAAPGEGPLLAIRDALRHADGSGIIVAACDLVDLDREAVELLLRAPMEESDVAVARAAGETHLLARWTPGTLARLDWIIDQGVRSFRGALRMLRSIEVEVPENAVRNVNRPEDLDR